MSIMDHQSDGNRFPRCFWCYDAYPCRSASAREECAEILRAASVPVHCEDGVEYAADLLDP